MPRDARFWRNVTIIALLHIAILLALIRWSRGPKKPVTSNIVWMNAGGGEAGDTTAPSATSASAPAVPKEEPPTVPPEIKPEPTKAEQIEEDEPILTAAKSDIQLATRLRAPLPRSIT